MLLILQRVCPYIAARIELQDSSPVVEGRGRPHREDPLPSMHRLISTLLIATVVAVAFVLPATTHARPAPIERPAKVKFLSSRAERVPDSYLVALSDQIGEADLDKVTGDLMYEYGARSGNRLKHAIRGFSAEMPEALARQLSEDPRVKYVEEDSHAGDAPIAKTVGDRGAETLRKFRKLQDARALQIVRTVESRGQNEVATKKGTGLLEQLHDCVLVDSADAANILVHARTLQSRTTHHALLVSVGGWYHSRSRGPSAATEGV